MTIKKSWKTTSAGILAIVGAIVRYYFHYKSGQPMTEEVVMTTITSISVGVGLIVSKDYNITGSPPRDVEDVKTVVQPKKSPGGGS